MLHYMAPEMVATEIVADRLITEKTDIWSCGVLMYYLLSGSLPFNVSIICEFRVILK